MCFFKHMGAVQSSDKSYLLTFLVSRLGVVALCFVSSLLSFLYNRLHGFRFSVDEHSLLVLKTYLVIFWTFKPQRNRRPD